MNTNTDTLLSTEESVNAALAYLASKDALHTLAEAVPVMGRDLCFWLPDRHTSLKGKTPFGTIRYGSVKTP